MSFAEDETDYFRSISKNELNLEAEFDITWTALMENRIYFDYNATTPCDPVVVESMLPFFNEDFGNPSSAHHPFGWIAQDAVTESTQLISDILGISSRTLIFTSGATESANMILKSFAQSRNGVRNHIITCKTEHKAVLDTCKILQESELLDVTYIGVDEKGLLDKEQLKASIKPETALVAVMHSNNETGTIQDLRELSEIIKDRGIRLFTDATQSLGKVSLKEVFDVADYACFSAHKLYGPKGIGLVYTKEGPEDSDLKCLIHGGGQQNRMRGGTLNTPAIVGFAKAVELAYARIDEEQKRLTSLRNRLEAGLSKIEMTELNSRAERRLPNTTNISFAYLDGSKLLRALSRHMAVSNGSACNSSIENPSHVLLAMGLDSDLAFSSLRISLGRYSTESEVDRAIEIINEEVANQRADNILWERRVT